MDDDKGSLQDAGAKALTGRAPFYGALNYGTSFSRSLLYTVLSLTGWRRLRDELPYGLTGPFTAKDDKGGLPGAGTKALAGRAPCCGTLIYGPRDELPCGSLNYGP